MSSAFSAAVPVNTSIVKTANGVEIANGRVYLVNNGGNFIHEGRVYLNREDLAQRTRLAQAADQFQARYTVQYQATVRKGPFSRLGFRNRQNSPVSTAVLVQSNVTQAKPRSLSRKNPKNSPIKGLLKKLFSKRR